jgi:hypothetical protein
MPVYAIKPPDRTRDLALDFLARMKSGSGFHTRGRLARAGVAVFLAAPHPVFNLTIEGIQEESPLEHARMTGWRFLAVSERAPLATLELKARYRTDDASFARITDSSMAQAVAAGLKNAEKSRPVRSGDYALGMVRMPALHWAALWLRDARGNGERDLFVPLAAARAAARATRVLTLQAFLAASRERVAKAERWIGQADPTGP